MSGDTATLPVVGLRASVDVSIGAAGNRAEFTLWSSRIRRYVAADGS